MKQASNFEIMKKALSTGEYAGLSIRVVNTSRFLIRLPDRDEWLDGKEGLAQELHYDRGWVLRQLKERLTMSSDLGDTAPYVAVDKVTHATERRGLSLSLHEYGRDTYSGVLAVPGLMNHIEKSSDSGNESPESIAGISSTKPSRILFNLVDAVDCTDRAGFDRVVHRRFVTVWLNSESGEYFAEKTKECKDHYAPLAHLSIDDISDDDLIRAMGMAPVAEIYHA